MSNKDFIKRVGDSAKEFAENFAEKAEDALEVLSDRAEDAFVVAREKGAEFRDKAQVALSDRETPNLNRARDLYAMMAQGKMMEAFEKYYDESVVMQENTEEPRRGKDANRVFLTNWRETIEEMHGGGVTSITSNEKEGLTAVESWVDVTLKGGTRRKMEEVAVQRWKDGKIVNERFYHE